MCSVTVSSIRYVIPPLISMYTHLTHALNNYPLMLLIIKRTAMETALLSPPYREDPGVEVDCREIKMESTRKLSNFNFQWTKTLYQNNLKNITFFFTFSRAKYVISRL